MLILTAMALTGCVSQPPSVPDESTEKPFPAITIEVAAVVTGLDTPWAVDFAPDGRIFITERAG